MTETLSLLLATSSRGVLATIRRNGRPQLSNVDFCYDPDRLLVRVSTTADRAKVACAATPGSRSTSRRRVWRRTPSRRARRAMVADGRLVIRVRVDRFYGFAPATST
jgi:hypothetical protein